MKKINGNKMTQPSKAVKEKKYTKEELCNELFHFIIDQLKPTESINSYLIKNNPWQVIQKFFETK